MNRNRHRTLLLWLAATDRTFERAELRGVEVLAGKCIHCNSLVAVGLDGEGLHHATIEHIVPRTHGGSDALENLAVACRRCNGEKGIRHDAQRWGDPKLMAMIERLQQRKQQRLREAPAWLSLPALERPHDEGEASAEASRARARRGRR